ncbi:nuclear transport factor 2 family protein [Kutzneria sp. NPDC051319]|uniref:nuclear transport factor 2 family protein n=1 Tax=Kutzneria sp. NPDC051319 TaxID=3155047 RepID=UPI0034496F43
MPTPAEVFEQFRLAGERSDVEGFLDLLADDVLMEWMYPIPGFPGQMRGREQLRKFYGRQSARVGSHRSTYRDVVLHESTDPEVVIAEYVRDMTAVDTGETVTKPCVAVLRVRDGKILNFRDYVQF